MFRINNYCSKPGLFHFGYENGVKINWLINNLLRLLKKNVE